MWKQLWRKWTVDKPAAFGDLVWEVFVVQFAAWLNRLDRLTLKHVITLALALILLLAYLHRIPVHPGLMLMGDVLAYIDIFSVIFLLSVMSRVENVVFILKQAAAHAIRLANNLLAVTKRLDFRNRREGGARTRKGASGRACSKDDDHPAIHGVAWA